MKYKDKIEYGGPHVTWSLAFYHCTEKLHINEQIKNKRIKKQTRTQCPFLKSQMFQ